MALYWLRSRTVRHAIEICRHVHKIVNAQRDLVPPKGIAEVEVAIEAIRVAVRAGEPKAKITELLSTLETVGNRWLKSYPHGALRENIEVVLVAIAVALAIRTFFLQPFKIPTGSMQPTLFGITHEDYRDQPDVKFPGPLQRFADYWLRGISYVHMVARSDGELREFNEPQTILPFVKRQRLVVGDESYTIWFPPEELIRHSNVRPGRVIHRGEDILKLKVITGDHLFVDRVTYNFRRPTRGEIIVFETAGIPEQERMRYGIPGDQFYIKRLVGLGGETLGIGDDRHVRVNGQRLDVSTPHFDNVYSFNPREPARDSHYSGHVFFGRLSSESDRFQVRSDHYVVMGATTMNSLDSRSWGDFPQESVIGKSFFVYWPILGKDSETQSRFGWAVH